MGLKRGYWEARRAVARTRRGGDADFWRRYQEMAGALVDLLAGHDVEVAGRQVVSLGCGDGAISLGLAHAARPALLVGVDSPPADPDRLLAVARAAGVADGLPDMLHFAGIEVEGIPAPDDTFDVAAVAASWADFRDLARPIVELRRVLRPGGTMALLLSAGWPPRRGETGDALAPNLEWVQNTVLLGGMESVATTLTPPPLGDDDLARQPLSRAVAGDLAILARRRTT